MAKELLLSKGRVAIVDDEDFEELTEYNWWYDGRYAVSNIEKGGKRKVYMHRFLLQPENGLLVDHKNGDCLDNRRVNLRIATYRENSANCRLHKHNTTGFKGVYRYSPGKSKKWRAAITYKDKQISLGYFTNPIEAADAYNKKAKELFGEFAKLNDI